MRLNSNTVQQFCTPFISVEMFSYPVEKYVQYFILRFSKMFQKVLYPHFPLKSFHTLPRCSLPGTQNDKWLTPLPSMRYSSLKQIFSNSNVIFSGKETNGWKGGRASFANFTSISDVTNQSQNSQIRAIISVDS